MEGTTDRALRFGVFELDLAARQLRKNGTRIKLQDQPFRVLQLLLERPGEIVTREELKEKLWSDDTFVEFDHSLNTSVQKIRQALRDSAEAPRFIETVPRVGYRFVAPVEVAGKGESSASNGQAGEINGSGFDGWRAIPWAPVAGIAALLAAAVSLMHFNQAPSERQALYRRFAFSPGGNVGQPAISPNGMHIVYVSGVARQTSLWILDLDQDEPRLLVGADDLATNSPEIVTPFWSADSKFIGFRNHEALRKVAVGGGDIYTVSKMGASFMGCSWSADGEIIVCASAPAPSQLYATAAQGGLPTRLFDEYARFPHFLQFGASDRTLLFSAGTPALGARIVALDLEEERRKELSPGVHPVYSPTGHVLFQPEGASGHIGAPEIWALPFSGEKMIATGEAFPVRENATSPTVSLDGTLVYLDLGPSQRQQLVWRDRNGTKLTTIGQPQRRIQMPVLSPDGSRVVVIAVEDPPGADVWIHEVARPVKTRVTFHPTNEDRPIWSPEGDLIIFSSPRRGGDYDLYLRPTDASGEARELYVAPENQWAYDRSRDGRF